MGHGCGYIEGVSDCGMCGRSQGGYLGGYRSELDLYARGIVGYFIQASEEALITAVNMLDEARALNDMLEERLVELEEGIEELYEERDSYRRAAELFEEQRDQARKSVHVLSATLATYDRVDYYADPVRPGTIKLQEDSDEDPDDNVASNK